VTLMTNRLHFLAVLLIAAPLLATAIPVLTNQLITTAATVKEFVALAPGGGGPGAGADTKFRWAVVEYPVGVSSTKDVSLSLLNESDPALGAWYDVDPGGLRLTAKIVGNELYALIAKKKDTPSGGGCCADTLRVYDKSTGKSRDIAIDLAAQNGTGVPSAYPSHTFDMSTLKDGTVVALLQVKEPEKAIGGASGDATVAVNVKDGSVVSTADGKSSFDMFRDAGTMSTATNDTRFKLPFFKESSGSEEWHGNGMLRFTSKAGTVYLAVTHWMLAEAVVFKDPFTYKASEGGGKIVQRFGTVSAGGPDETAGYRYFGVPSGDSAFDSGVHNVFYRAAAEALGGAESISLFVNDQDGKAAAYEFGFKPVEEGSAADDGTDAVFATKSVHAKLSFDAQAQGGARAIGNGVFLVMSGADSTGLEVADTAGNTKYVSYPGGGPDADVSAGVLPMYDPFIRVVVT